MAAFQFPDPAVNPTVVNPITGSTYQYKEDPGKWILVAQPRTVIQDLVWEGDNPPLPVGEYKLWYSTDTLELYFYYCDENSNCAWVPTSVPIQVLEDLNVFAAQAEVDIDQLQYKQQLLQNTIDQIYLEQNNTKAEYVKRSGDTMEGELTLNAGPTEDLHAATKNYVDDADNLLEEKITDLADSVVLKAGSTMTGPLILNADPTEDLGAATKAYVDSKVQNIMETSARLYRAVDGPPGPNGEIYLGYFSGTSRHVLNLSSKDLADQDTPDLTNYNYCRILGPDGVDELGTLEEGLYFMRSEPFRLRLTDNISYLLRFY